MQLSKGEGRKMMVSSAWLILLALALSSPTPCSASIHAFRVEPTANAALAAADIATIPRGGGFGRGRNNKNKKVVVAKSSGSKTSNNNNGKASIITSIFNLANNVAGAGILTLAAGKATGTGWIPSILTCISLAFVSAHTFTLIGKACEMTGHSTFKGLWSDAFGSSTAWIVDSMVFIQCFLVSIIYTGLLGDIFSALLGTTKRFASISRTQVIVGSAISVLWPLNMIRDLSALGFTSILGLVAVLYTVFFIVLRALDGSYALNTGSLVAAAPFLPTFAKSSLWNFDLNSLVLMSNLGLAFIAHYNGPTYWKSLSNASTQRFNKVSYSAYAVLAVIYTTTMVAGYATFGDVCQGNILLNYASTDSLAILGRLATGLSIIFGFPLISNGAREGLKSASSALGVSSISNPDKHFWLVTCLLLATTSMSIVLTDIKLVAGLSGAVMGSSLVYICPTLIYAKIVQQKYGANSKEYQVAKRNLLLIPFGLFTASMGVTMTLKNTVLA